MSCQSQASAIAQSIRSAADSARASGQSSVPVAWLDAWASAAERASVEPFTPPLLYYTSPLYHPIHTFIWPFVTRFRVR